MLTIAAHAHAPTRTDWNCVRSSCSCLRISFDSLSPPCLRRPSNSFLIASWRALVAAIASSNAFTFALSSSTFGLLIKRCLIHSKQDSCSPRRQRRSRRSYMATPATSMWFMMADAADATSFRSTKSSSKWVIGSVICILSRPS